jgi:tRNA(adenine34) deaminase
VVHEVDDYFMGMALEEALKGKESGEVPVGAVVVDSTGSVLGRGFNQPISSGDPTAHAEILALRAAAKALNNYRLSGLTLYCTLEPCAMCSGAIVHARIERLVFGAADRRAGAAGSLYNIVDDPRLNHRVDVLPGVRGKECRELLGDFFAKRRSGHEF